MDVRLGGVAAPRPRIGGTLELTPRHSYLPGRDKLVLLTLLTLSVVLHATVISRSRTTARDGLGFARMALQLESPKRAAASLGLDRPTLIDVVKSTPHPPGYAISVLAVSKVVRAIDPPPRDDSPAAHAALGERMLRSAQIASSLAGILLVVPMFLAGRMLFGRFAGALGTAMFQVLPVPASITSDALSESLFLLGLWTSFAFGIRALRRCGIGSMVACGLTIGMTYLVRPEGLLMIFAMGAAVLILRFRGSWPWMVVAGRLTALGAGVAIVAVPYMMVIQGITNKPSGIEAMNRLMGGPRQNLGKFDQGCAPQPTVLFAAFTDPNDPNATTLGQAKFAAVALLKEVAKSSFYVPLVLAVIGVCLVRGRLSHDPGLGLILLYAAFNALLLLAFAMKIGYLSERHTLPLASCAAMLAAASLEPIGRVMAAKFTMLPPRRFALGMCAAIMLACLPSLMKPLPANRLPYIEAGRFLSTLYRPGDIIVDPFAWTEFYAGANVTDNPFWPDKAPVVYSVLDGPRDGSSHLRLPKLDLARSVAQSGEPIYHWPPDGPHEDAKVVVYRTIRK
jgi:hypothetical protein